MLFSSLFDHDDDDDDVINQHDDENLVQLKYIPLVEYWIEFYFLFCEIVIEKMSVRINALISYNLQDDYI